MSKGFIKRSTLTAIADAIRTKTRSTDLILPADMAAMIDGIETGNGGIMQGTFYGRITDEVSLGVTLPDADNYLFACTVTDSFDPSNVSRHITSVVIAKVQGVKTCYAVEPRASSTNIYGYTHNADLTTGDAGSTVLTCDEFSNVSDTYEWWYVYG